MVAVRIQHGVVDLGAAVLDYIATVLYPELVCNGLTALGGVWPGLGQIDTGSEKAEINVGILPAGRQNHRIRLMRGSITIAIGCFIAALIFQGGVPALQNAAG